MKWLLRSIIFLIVVFSFSTAIAKDTVTAHILLDFDKNNFKVVDPVSQISAGGIVKLWGWLKIETQGNIEPQTYYLEWEYKNGDKNEILGNYNTNKQYLEYKRKLDRADDYYWVSKRVWVQEKGNYVFRVYIKENNEFKIIKQTSVSIKE
jgi:hypothetical protein